MQKTNKIFMLLILILSTTFSCAKEKEITINLTVPDTTWQITIDDVYIVENELWVISTVSQNPDLMGAQVISKIQASVKLAAPDLPVKHFVLGKSWHWENDEPCIFIQDIKQIEKDLKSARHIYMAGKSEQ